MDQDRNEMSSVGARRRKKRPMRRPLIVGALAVVTITLGASAAVALGTTGDSPPLPLTITSEEGMPGHNGVGMMGGSDMSMPGHNGVDMMGGSDMKGSADMKMGDHMGTSITGAKAADAGNCTMSGSDSKMNDQKGKGMPGHQATGNGVMRS